MSCSIGCRRGSDLALLWLWHRSAATAPIRPLAWEPPFATGAALKRTERQKKKKKKKKAIESSPVVQWVKVTTAAQVQSLAQELLHAMGVHPPKKYGYKFFATSPIKEWNPSPTHTIPRLAMGLALVSGL